MIDKIVSGGQSGVDRAALDAAISLNINHGGYCPHGRLAEDGTINSIYSLTETQSPDYLVRTRLNTRYSDATLILYTGTLKGGTKYTYNYAKYEDKPVMLFNMNVKFDLNKIIEWILENNISVLNIAGPRESKNPGIYIKAKKLITEIISIEKLVKITFDQNEKNKVRQENIDVCQSCGIRRIELNCMIWTVKGKFVCIPCQEAKHKAEKKAAGETS